jgi:leucyl/phenylalanyl-tRNA---protein transferase
MQYLTNELYFPPISQTSPQGILAAGGDLSPERLLLAYNNGIFPWFDHNEPILWWCPEKRMVLFPDEFKMSHSMRNVLNQKTFHVTINRAFKEVMKACQTTYRQGQNGTWITDEMIDSYFLLFEQKKAMSVEVWQNKELVGGLYGVDLGHVFCGESMFSKVSNASKTAFVYLVNFLKENNYKLLDCQIHNDHLQSLGCREIPRDEFIKILKNH